MRQAPKYALFENERRFLIGQCPDLSSTTFRTIEDLYITGSRLRLRAITHNDGRPAEFKFCKKYPSDDNRSGPVVNIYLAADEYRTLSQLPGKTIRKRRYLREFADSVFSLDIFEVELAGLALSEVEAPSVGALDAIPVPPWTLHEVTDDAFFRGANLAETSASDLRTKLLSLGLA